MCSSARLLSAFFVAVFHVSKVPVEGQLQTCRNGTENVVFLGFVPCSLNMSQSSGTSRSSAREILEECDVLVEAAVELAVDRINGNPDVLVNTTLHVEQLSEVLYQSQCCPNTLCTCSYS